MALLTLAASAACGRAAASADCTAAPGLQRLAEGPVTLLWRTEPAAPAVGQAFVLHVELCPAGARLLRVDATMPEHRHGMNYRPSLHALAPGRWRADGLLWHMPGRWELRFEVEPPAGTAGATRQVLTQRIELQ